MEQATGVEPVTSISRTNPRREIRGTTETKRANLLSLVRLTNLTHYGESRSRKDLTPSQMSLDGRGSRRVRPAFSTIFSGPRIPRRGNRSPQEISDRVRHTESALHTDGIERRDDVVARAFEDFAPCMCKFGGSLARLAFPSSFGGFSLARSSIE